MKKSKVLGLLLLAVALVCTSVLGTIAYLTSEDEVVNTFTVGDVDIVLDETAVDENGVPKEGADRVKSNQYHLIPGSTYVKDPTMSVLKGSEESYVRMIVTLNCYEELKAIFGEEFLPQDFVNGWDKDTWVSTEVIDVDAQANTATYEFRYKDTVKPGKDEDLVLDALFDEIFMPEEVTGEQLATIANFEIKVVGHAIQKSGFESADEAWLTFDGNFVELKANATAQEFIDALNKLEKEQALYLLGDTSDLGTVELSKDVRVFLGGHTFNGNLELNDNTVEFANGKVLSSTLYNKGNLVLNNVNVESLEGEKAALTIADNANVSLIIKNDVDVLGGKGADAIKVEPNGSLVVTGKGSLSAIGNNGKEYLNTTYNNTDDTTYLGTNGSGIGNTDGDTGVIVIKDLNNLVAEGYGVNAFGIGGSVEHVDISKTTIDYVRGGFAEDNNLSDAKYGKSEAEGGAAIGSSKENAVIDLNHVVINKAEGGSKAAAIGGRYWTAISVNISDSQLYDIIGGNNSAAIGGSRVRGSNPESQTIDINIHNSTVVAKGGDFGAGIGSGYDTHCAHPSPITTINITGNSDITAVGGKYGAGIGTGYHVGGLSGMIENSVSVNASVTDSFYKNSYSTAQPVGFGVVDPAREGQTAMNCTFDYKGTTIRFEH